MKLQEFLLFFFDLLRIALVLILLVMVIPAIWDANALIGKEPHMIIILLVIVMLYSMKVSSLYDRIKELKKIGEIEIES